MKKIQAVITFLLFNLVLISCKKDNNQVASPQNQNEEELITTITVSFKKTPTATDSIMFSWKDLDGDGGNNPVINPIIITTEYTYMSVYVLNESNPSDIKDISSEIREEGTQHQLFYTTSTGYMDLVYQDMDDNGVPIGLKMTLSSLITVTDGTLQIVLKHQPAIKPTSGQGNSSLGASDFDVTFPITIQ